VWLARNKKTKRLTRISFTVSFSKSQGVPLPVFLAPPTESDEWLLPFRWGFYYRLPDLACKVNNFDGIGKLSASGLGALPAVFFASPLLVIGAFL
jgi:hypothetical protein